MKTLLNRKTAVALAFCLSASSGLFGQTQKVVLPKDKATVSALVKVIRKQTHMSVDFSQNMIDTKKTVVLKRKEMTLAELMTLLLEGNDHLTYRIVGRHIVVVRRAGTVHLTYDISATRQKHKLTGRVFDSNGDPIVGASVQEKGTSNVTVTDTEGRYTLLTYEANPILHFSYIGFEPKQVKARDNRAASITMSENVHGLDELVIVVTVRRRRRMSSDPFPPYQAGSWRHDPQAMSPICLRD